MARPMLYADANNVNQVEGRIDGNQGICKLAQL